MYDAICNDYDRFVNWQNRLKVEMPFITQQIQRLGLPKYRIMDAACGTGIHTIALAQLGHQVSGADLSQGMIDRARLNARTAAVDIRFEPVGFGYLAEKFGRSTFDCLLCLGNSLPHLLDPGQLSAALTDFAACLNPGGLLLIQNRNFNAVMANRERWMEPQAYRQGDNEWLFLRFYDFDPDGLLSFHMITLQRRGENPWTQQVTTTRLYPLQQNELLGMLKTAGFEYITCYGSMSGNQFDPATSGNLVITAILK